MRDKLQCPECGETFRFSFIKNAFSSRIVCPKCGKKLFVENKTFPYILIAAILFLAVDYVFPFVEGFGLSQAFTNILVFLVLAAMCYLLIIVCKYVIGAGFLYNVRCEKYYEQQKQDAERMKQQVSKKRKKTQEKK